MRVTQSKAILFALGLVAWSAPCIALVPSEPSASPLPDAATFIIHKSAAAPSGEKSGDANLPLAALRPMGDDELENARGGFNVGGVNFNFGASVQTLVNGQLALQTNVQWTPAGAVVSQVQGLGTKIQTEVASTLANAGINVPAPKTAAQPLSSSNAPSQGAPAPGATANSAPAPTSSPVNPSANAPTASNPAPVTASGASVMGGNIAALGGATAPASPGSSPVANIPATGNASPSTSVTIPVTFAPAGSSSAPAVVPSAAGNTTSNSGTPASISNPNLLSGVQIQSATGSTQVLANVANGQIQNIILNTASNQSIVQNTNIVLTISNFSDWQRQLGTNSVLGQLSRDQFVGMTLH